jgi:hypothetical protein
MIRLPKWYRMGSPMAVNSSNGITGPEAWNQPNQWWACDECSKECGKGCRVDKVDGRDPVGCFEESDDWKRFLASQKK